MKFAAAIEYDGTAYYGWQSQPHAKNIQDCVEKALSAVADHEVDVVCAGRTDTGVHAVGQVIHFNTDANRDERSWLLGINSILPSDIAITWLRAVSDEFHARYSAKARYYRYIIRDQWLRPAISRHRAAWIKEKLEVSVMQQAATLLQGKHDYSAFRSAACQSHTPIREIYDISLTRAHKYIYLDIKANAFLHHMVRNIVGTLLEIGTGNHEPAWAAEVLEKRDRSIAGVTAPAHGLYLVGIDYPEEFSVPGPPQPPGCG